MARTFGSTSARLRGYKAGTVLTASAPAAPSAPVLGAITVPSGTIKRVAITTFPADANYLTREVSLNGGAYASAGAALNIGTTYFDVDVGSASTWSFRSKAGNSGGESSYSNAVSSNSIVVNGSGFGTKTTAAPYKFFPLINDANGQTAFQVGMDMYQADTSFASMATVQTGTSELGKSLVTTKVATAITPPGDGMTPAMGVFLPNGTTKVFASFRLKITKSFGGNNSARVQWKTPRAGVLGATAYSDGNNAYSASGIKIHAENYAEGSGVMDSSAGFDLYLSNSSNTGILSGQGGDNEVTGWSSFNSGYNMFDANGNDWRVYYDTGTIGGSDGAVYYWCNNKLVGRKTGLAIRLAGSTTNPLQQILLLTGLQFLDPGTWTMQVSRIAVDIGSQARIELINASTYAAATRCIFLPPTAWSDTQVNVNDIQLTSIPAGYDWVAVTNASGTTQVFAR